MTCENSWKDGRLAILVAWATQSPQRLGIGCSCFMIIYRNQLQFTICCGADASRTVAQALPLQGIFHLAAGGPSSEGKARALSSRGMPSFVSRLSAATALKGPNDMTSSVGAVDVVIGVVLL
jgi:hypothetical protein